MAVSVLLSAFIIGELVSLVIAVAALWSRRQHSLEAEGELSLSDVTVVIPVLGAPDHLQECLKAVAGQLPASKQILVVLQDPEGNHRALVEKWGDDAGEVALIELPGSPSKAKAVRLGLSEIQSKWVIMLDADTILTPGAISNLLNAVAGKDAAFGIIVPREAGGSSLLDGVVRLEKLLSHGLWRPGRWALGVGANLPGQCYVARTATLRAMYAEDLGFLDDVALSGCMFANHARISFSPALVASEFGRATWLGLLLQRGRYTVGVLQTFGAVYRCGGARAWAWLCLSLHVWLYYGSCIAAVGLVVVFLAHGWLEGMALFVVLFISYRLVLVCLASLAFRRFSVSSESVWPGWMLVPSILILPVMKALGVFVAVGMCVRGSAPSLYRR